MGRRKKSKERQCLYDERSMKAEAECNGWDLPITLENWRRYFLNEKSYLKNFSIWLNRKYAGEQRPTVTDDVDRGLMKVGPFYTQHNQPSWHQQDEDDDRDWWNRLPKYGGAPWWREPKEPVISPPSELSGVELHAY